MAERDEELDYQYAQTFFSRWDSLHDASTWHGWLVGFLAAKQDPQVKDDATPWYQQAMLWLDIGDVSLNQEDEVFIKRFFNAALSMTENNSVPFQAMIPDQRAPLAQRVSCVAFWAESFLLGFAAVPIEARYLNKDTQDALRDMAEISQIDVEEDEETDLEPHFQAVLEHLNVLAQVIYTRDTQAPKTVH